MEKHTIKFLKEKELQKKAIKNAEFLEKQFAQNPIKAKFCAFAKTKKDITIKDLF